MILTGGMNGGSGLTVSVRNLRAQNGGSEISVTVVIGNGENSETRTLVISTEQYCELNLQKGQISEEQFEQLEKASGLFQALRCGENLLSYGSNSVQALARKIARHGFSREESLRAAEILRERGLINEQEDVRRELEKCLKKLWGAGRIRTHLWSKGFDKEALEILPELLEEIDFAENCARLIQKHYGGLPADQEELRRMNAGLYRYGYTLEEIRAAFRLLRAE